MRNKSFLIHLLNKSCLAIVAVAVLLSFSNSQSQAIETIAREAILVEMATGEVLFEKDADQLMPPASMSKLMAVYMLFERLRDGSLSLEDSFPISENAWRKGGAKSGSSTMFLEPGKRVKVQDLIPGIIVQSGNDAAIVVAEGLASSEEAFAEEMTIRARELGMSKSVFKNATGWPDPEHFMTARDLSILSRALIKEFPEFMPYFAIKEFTYNGIRQMNRNPLIYKDMGADGLKTGYTEESGYGLVVTAKRGDRRLILVTNGLPSKKERSREPERLLEWGFREFNNYSLFKAGEEITKAEVWLGEQPDVSLVIAKDVLLTLPRKARSKMKVRVVYEGPIPAPIKIGDVVARVVIDLPDQDPIEIPLQAGNNVEQLGLVGRLGAALKSILWGRSG